MGRRRKAGVMLPEHVHAVHRGGGRFDYYWHAHRGTARQGQRVRLPVDPLSAEFWQAVAKLQRGPAPEGGIATMIDAYVASPWFAGLSSKTQVEYRRYLREFRDLAGDQEPADILPHHVAAYRDSLSATPARANAALRALSALYVWGREGGHCSANPADRIKKLRIGSWEPWEPWAWALAMEHLRPELRLFCLLALFTGQRLGDVLAMRLSDVRGGAVAVRQHKTGKRLEIPLHREIADVPRQCAERGHLYLVSKADGTPLNQDDFHAMWGREMAREALAPIRRAGFVPHGLRKNAAARLAEVGCTSNEIASITGQSLRMVEHYTRQADQFRLATSAISKLEENSR